MTRYQSAEYVERFRCDGKACGAQCCRGWAIELSEQDRLRIEREYEASLVTLSGKRTAISKASLTEKNASRPYRIQFDSSGACPFLRDDLMCDVQTHGGLSVLPDICAQYPREVGVIAGKREMWATLACPEAARQCLFSPTALRFVELEEPLCLRHINNQLDVNEQTSDYHAYLDEVRMYVVELLGRKQYPLRTRLFAVAYFGHRVAPYFSQKHATVDYRRLRHDMDSVATATFLEGLERELESNTVPGNYAMALVGSVIPLSGTASAEPRSGAAGSTGKAAASLALDSDTWLQAWMDYCVKRMRWERDFSELIELAFENYAKVFWLKDWYVTAPNLLVYASACVLRIAIMRYRLFTNMSLCAVADSESQEGRRKLLEQALLEVVSETCRTIDHDRAFRSTLHDALARRDMEDLAHVGILLMI